jgi:hypothetical protein
VPWAMCEAVLTFIHSEHSVEQRTCQELLHSLLFCRVPCPKIPSPDTYSDISGPSDSFEICNSCSRYGGVGAPVAAMQTARRRGEQKMSDPNDFGSLVSGHGYDYYSTYNNTWHGGILSICSSSIARCDVAPVSVLYVSL